VDGLDPVMRRKPWSLVLADVSEHETTVVISSHNLRELEDVCDHVGIMNGGKVVIEKSLSDLQGGVAKLQVVFNGERPPLEEEFEILSEHTTGKIHTLIVKGAPELAERRLMRFVPLFAEALPLTLEEIFIYEMGGEDDAVKEILL
ncbi:MAG: ABC transporter ATP-binding protein, partial [Lachnospiraceae bacterium]|nr:ABC transporter ATP-binding protein [Lachnospiraceae bacterium]